MAADWSERGEYIAKHDMTPELADEALSDPDALTLNPDPASKSGASIRTIGYSTSFGGLVTVITVDHEGTTYGVNAWASNDTDTRKYQTENGEQS